MQITAKLWKHQERLAGFAADNKKVLWLAGVGVGKTLASLRAAELVGAKAVLVLTLKKALHNVWENEITKFVRGVDVLVLDKGTSKEKQKRLDLELTRAAAKNRTLFIVVNYETARLLNLENRFDMAIADESHRLKSPTSKQTLSLTKMLSNVPVKIAMTGTAWSERPTDVYGQVRWLIVEKRHGHPISPILGSWTQFFERYVRYNRVNGIPIVIGYKNLEELAETISPLVMELRQRDVLDLPDELDIYRWVTLPADIAEAYRAFEKQFYTQVAGGYITAPNILTNTLRLHQMTSGIYSLDGENGVRQIVQHDELVKLDETLEILEEAGNEPVVIFTNFRTDIQILSEALKGSVSIVDGAHDQYAEWWAGKTRILLANLQSGSTGLNMTRARIGIFYSLNYSRTLYEQARGRLVRPGADLKQKVVFYHILARNTVDNMLLDVLQSKGNTADELRKMIITQRKITDE